MPRVTTMAQLLMVLGSDRVNLKLLPLPLPEVQMGDPLPEWVIPNLPPEQIVALNDLFHLADEADEDFKRGNGLPVARYKVMKAALETVVQVGAGGYCAVVRIAVCCALSPEMVRRAAKALTSKPVEWCSVCGQG